ncbi:MAG: hypothetical protein PBV86_06245, partial [Delftia lacustris]
WTWNSPKNFLRAKSPCAAGFRWFVRNRHDGNDYQRVLDALVGDGRVEDARWLMNQFGPTDAVLEVDHLEADALVFSGSVVVHGELRVPGLLAVGRTLQAGAGIHAGRIEAGQGPAQWRRHLLQRPTAGRGPGQGRLERGRARGTARRGRARRPGAALRRRPAPGRRSTGGRGQRGGGRPPPGQGRARGGQSARPGR